MMSTRKAFLVALALVLGCGLGQSGRGLAFATEFSPEIQGALDETENEMSGQALGMQGGMPDWMRSFGAISIRGLFEQAVGFYSSGELVNASNFLPEAPGFVKIFRPRDRAWATSDLVELVSEAASELHGRFASSERLQLGDVAQKSGGKVGLHASHQNGLDVDIAYYRVNRLEQDPDATNGFHETFVREGVLSPNFDVERNWALLDRLVATGRVNRIFVDGVIKKAMCLYARSEGLEESRLETLRRLRSWPNHADHLHLRITCPSGSPRCVVQAEPPEGTGCDEI